LGYASIPGNKLAFRMELMLSGDGSSHALTRDADASEHVPLPRAAAALFRTSEKGPRADQYLAVKTDHLRRQAIHLGKRVGRGQSAPTGAMCAMS
jgi:hypothetical protein